MAQGFHEHNAFGLMFVILVWEYHSHVHLYSHIVTILVREAQPMISLFLLILKFRSSSGTKRNSDILWQRFKCRGSDKHLRSVLQMMVPAPDLVLPGAEGIFNH